MRSVHLKCGLRLSQCTNTIEFPRSELPPGRRGPRDRTFGSEQPFTVGKFRAAQIHGASQCPCPICERLGEGDLVLAPQLCELFCERHKILREFLHRGGELLHRCVEVLGREGAQELRKLIPPRLAREERAVTQRGTPRRPPAP